MLNFILTENCDWTSPYCVRPGEMSTIKILPELDAASSRVLSRFNVEERRCVAVTETNIKLPELGLESQTNTNCLVAAAVQQMRAACGGQEDRLTCSREYLSQVGDWNQVNGTSCYPACTRYGATH